MRTLNRTRWILALALLCVGAFSVPFAVTWFIENDDAVAKSHVEHFAYIPSSYPTSSGISEPAQPLSIYQLSNKFQVIEAITPNFSGFSPEILIDEVRKTIANSFYVPVSEATLELPSVGQIIEALGDPYTTYLSPSEFAMARESSVSVYEGVGLLVSPSDIGLIVTSALRGPARKAGIRPGDEIISIDGKTVNSLSFDHAISLFQGELGSVVTLIIKRPGEEKKRIARVVRDLIDTPTFRTRNLKSKKQNLGYIRLLSFQRSSGNQVRQATKDLIAQGAEGVVLDLRSNPGGYLQEALEVTSVFLRAGIICSTSGSHQEPEFYMASGNAPGGDIPIVTLVDEYSASASEIVAAALRDNNRGKLVGVSTFGKASVQSIIALGNGGGLQLTTSTYLTASGDRIAGRGITPDIAAEDDPLTHRDEGLQKARKVLTDLVERRYERPELHF